MLNIYLDIDGVLRGTASPKEDIIELVEFCLQNHPNSTYWLTTHCKHGENHAESALKGLLPDALVEQACNTFLPTEWEVLKTDAIDFNQDFVWLDDTLFQSERIVLEKNNVLDSFFRMDPKDPKSAQNALTFLKSREKANATE